jgi:hypothetical protein
MQTKVYDHLFLMAKPKPAALQSCEDICAALGLTETDANLRLIWDALDDSPLYECCEVVNPGRLYVLRVE